jgi:AAA family ATP:ADP antiporter
MSANNIMMNFLQMISKIKQREIKAVFFSFLFVVVLMTAYYILRPVRDAMASDWTDAEVSWLWTLNFFISTGIVSFVWHCSFKVSFSTAGTDHVRYLC